MSTIVKRKSTHDRMTFTAKFDNGDIFNFNISRSRDSFSATQLVTTEKLSAAEFKTITEWCKQGDDENHEQRHARADALCMKAHSLEGLAMLAEMELSRAIA